MRNTKVLVCATLFMVAAAGAMFVASGPSTAAADQKVSGGNHWQYNDGHWNYWNDGDQSWYYTDGSNWFANNGTNWNVYGFDRQFGRDGFEHGDYKAPQAGAKIASPTHGVSKGGGKK